jgi:hypothetical protein
MVAREGFRPAGAEQRLKKVDPLAKVRLPPFTLAQKEDLLWPESERSS